MLTKIDSSTFNCSDLKRLSLHRMYLSHSNFQAWRRCDDPDRCLEYSWTLSSERGHPDQAKDRPDIKYISKYLFVRRVGSQVYPGPLFTYKSITGSFCRPDRGIAFVLDLYTNGHSTMIFRASSKSDHYPPRALIQQVDTVHDMVYNSHFCHGLLLKDCLCEYFM